MKTTVVLLFWFTALLANKVEVLTPPVITEGTIANTIACTRPMREGKFNISAEKQNDKYLIHCYGHGGSGCTTSFGSVRRAIELFEQQFPEAPKTPIRVIGAGYIGLTAAIELSLKGYKVSGITAKELYDIASWKNAGYFALVSVKTDENEQPNLNRIGKITFEEYKKIYEGKHPYITSECVRYLPVYCSVDTEAGVEDLEAKGLIPPREYVTLDFGNNVQHENFVKYMTYFMDTTHIMMQLRAKVASLGIEIEEKELTSFNELAETIVFNCSGLGAKQLNHDEKMIAVRGHLVNLNQDSGSEHMNYMIYTKLDDGSYIYMLPKCFQVTPDNISGKDVYGTLGGTFIPNTDLLSDDELFELDKAEFKKMLDRNNLFFWGKPYKKESL
jgi:D-amino-acid oxidase